MSARPTSGSTQRAGRALLRRPVHRFLRCLCDVTEWSRYGGASPVDTPEVIPREFLVLPRTATTADATASSHAVPVCPERSARASCCPRGGRGARGDRHRRSDVVHPADPRPLDARRARPDRHGAHRASPRTTRWPPTSRSVGRPRRSRPPPCRAAPSARPARPGRASRPAQGRCAKAKADARGQALGAARSGTGHITSGFGWRWGKTHDGIDFGAADRHAGSYAMSKGMVICRVCELGFGNKVEIRYWDGPISWYGHMSKRIAQKGDTVMPGRARRAGRQHRALVRPAPAPGDPAERPATARSTRCRGCATHGLVRAAPTGTPAWRRTAR